MMSSSFPLLSFVFLSLLLSSLLPSSLSSPPPTTSFHSPSPSLTSYDYQLTLTRENPNDLPILSSWTSSPPPSWLYNYNVAYVPFVPAQLLNEYYPLMDWTTHMALGVAVRVQNLTSHPTNIYDVGPSEIVYTVGICLVNDIYSCEFNTEMLSDPSFIIVNSHTKMNHSYNQLGVEDPRVVYVANEDMLLLFHTDVFTLPNGDAQATLSLSVCKDASLKTNTKDFLNCWVDNGPIIDPSMWSKSGGFLTMPFTQIPFEGEMRKQKEKDKKGQHHSSSSPPTLSPPLSMSTCSPSLTTLLSSFTFSPPLPTPLTPITPFYFLFYGDTNIYVAITTDLLHYSTLVNQTTGERYELFTTREASEWWDNTLVESGPEPLSLSLSGDFLYLYNSGDNTKNISNPKPHWDTEYNLGFVILQAQNPLQIVERATVPLLSPVLPWEICDDQTGGIWQSRCLTPLVVFVEGWRKVGSVVHGDGSVTDEFMIIYQGGDSAMGMAKLMVDIIPKKL